MKFWRLITTTTDVVRRFVVRSTRWITATGLVSVVVVTSGLMTKLGRTEAAKDVMFIGLILAVCTIAVIDFSNDPEKEKQ